MPIRIQCPACQAKANAPDAAAGKTLTCPKCKTSIHIPPAATIIPKRPPEPQSSIAREPLKRGEPFDIDDEPPIPREADTTRAERLRQSGANRRTGMWIAFGGLALVTLIAAPIFACCIVPSWFVSQVASTTVPVDTRAPTGAGSIAAADAPKSRDKPASKDKPTEPKRDWLDASAEVYVEGDATLVITGVRIGRVTGDDLFGGSRELKEDALAISFRVTNGSDRKILSYSLLTEQSSFSFGNHTTLHDDIGNQYRHITTPSSIKIKGAARDDRVKPMEMADSVVLFEPPVAKMEFLEVSFPGFEKSKVVKFRIPKSMITSGK